MDIKCKESTDMIIPKESKIEEKRDSMIEDLVNKGVFKIDGKQLYELNLYELTKEYIIEEES
jgi:hypothetical protein